MTMFHLSPTGDNASRESTARRALKSWSWRLLKDRRQGLFLIIDLKTGAPVSVDGHTALTLLQVETWFNNQGLLGKIGIGNRMHRDFSEATMSSGQRVAWEFLQCCPPAEIEELVSWAAGQLSAKDWQNEFQTQLAEAERHAHVAAVTKRMFEGQQCTATSEKVHSKYFGEYEVITLDIKPAADPEPTKV